MIDSPHSCIYLRRWYRERLLTTVTIRLLFFFVLTDNDRKLLLSLAFYWTDSVRVTCQLRNRQTCHNFSLCSASLKLLYEVNLMCLWRQIFLLMGLHVLSVLCSSQEKIDCYVITCLIEYHLQLCVTLKQAFFRYFWNWNVLRWKALN